MVHIELFEGGIISFSSNHCGNNLRVGRIMIMTTVYSGGGGRGRQGVLLPPPPGGGGGGGGRGVLLPPPPFGIDFPPLAIGSLCLIWGCPPPWLLALGVWAKSWNKHWRPIPYMIVCVCSSCLWQRYMGMEAVECRWFFAAVCTRISASQLGIVGFTWWLDYVFFEAWYIIMHVGDHLFTIVFAQIVWNIYHVQCMQSEWYTVHTVIPCREFRCFADVIHM